jgi:hypothetical protein
MDDEIISIGVRFSTHNHSAMFSGGSSAWSSSRRSEVLQKLNDEVRGCYAQAANAGRAIYTAPSIRSVATINRTVDVPLAIGLIPQRHTGRGGVLTAVTTKVQ